jgi:hypothetical protein
MITQKTVFVLGAGASKPYGFPTGLGLRAIILNKLHWGDAQWTPVLSELGFDQRQVDDFNAAFRHSARPSVDLFVEHRREFLTLGKAAIALSLIPFEKPDAVFNAPPGEDWYQYVFARMDAPFAEFGKNQVSFVTFNYDRSLEHFFRTALANAYGKSVGEATELLKQIPIIHVHGLLGALSGQGAPATRPYSEKYTTRDVRCAMDALVIMSEADGDSTTFTAARAEMESASRVYFLGFAYHPSNMNRLRVSAYQNKIAGGTSLGLGVAEREDIQTRWRVPTFVGLQWADDLDSLGFLKNAAHLG